MYGYKWVCMDLYGYARVYMGIYGYVWVYKGMYGYVQVCYPISPNSPIFKNIKSFKFQWQMPTLSDLPHKNHVSLNIYATDLVNMSKDDQ